MATPVFSKLTQTVSDDIKGEVQPLVDEANLTLSIIQNLLPGAMYDTTTDGVNPTTGVAAGQFFVTWQDNRLRIYLNNNGTAILKSELSTTAQNDSLYTKISDLISPVDGKGSALVGFKNTELGSITRNLLLKASDIYSAKDRGAVGDGISNDTTKVGGSSRIMRLPKGVYPASSAQLIGSGGLIGDGWDTIIKQNALNNEYVIGRNDSDQAEYLWLENLVIDGNKSLGVFTGEGNGLDIRGFKYVFIDKVTVINCYGHGIRFRNCDTVVIGTLLTMNNNKFGTVFESNNPSSVRNIFFDKIISIGDGHDGIGWTGVDFGDCNADLAGPQKIVGNMIVAKQSGKVGVALGRVANTAGTTTGPREIHIGEIDVEDSGINDPTKGTGVEIFASKSVQIGSIRTKNTGGHGVWINKGDDLITQSERVNIGSILSEESGRHGVYINGAFVTQISNIIARNSGKAGLSNAQSGVAFFGDNNASLNGYIHIGSIISYDDQTIKTQQYGVRFMSGSQFGKYSIGSLKAYNNVIADLSVESSVEVDISQIDAPVILPTYPTPGTENQLIKIAGRYRARSQTLNNTVKAIWSYPLPPNSVNIVIAHVMCNEGLAGESAYYSIYSRIRRNGTNNATLVADGDVISPTESNTNISTRLNVSGTDNKVYLNVTGLASKTLNWAASIEIISTPV